MHESENEPSYDSDEFEHYVGLYMQSNIKSTNYESTVKLSSTSTDDSDPHYSYLEKRFQEDHQSSSSSEATPRQKSSFDSNISDRSMNKKGTTSDNQSSRDSLFDRLKHGKKINSTSAKERFDIKVRVKSSQSTSYKHVPLSPRPPRLRTTEKNGEKLYSTSARKSFDDIIYSFRSSSPSRGQLGSTGPPRLRTTERHGDRQYSTFGNSYVRNELTPNSVGLGNNRPRITIPRAPRLRTMEKNGQKKYSFSSSASERDIPRARTWDGSSNKRSVTVPVPFNLSKSPNKFSQTNDSSTQHYAFRALPLPDFTHRTFQINHDIKNRKSTIPLPFHLSETIRRTRSHSPLISRRGALQKNSLNARDSHRKYLKRIAPRSFIKNKKSLSTTKILKRNNSYAKRKNLATKRNSKMSKHKFSKQKDTKKMNLYNYNELIEYLNLSVNPNLNASRAARRKHLLQVAAEVARLRQEWKLYYEEANRLRDELKQGKRERKAMKKKLQALATNDIALSKQLEQDIVDLEMSLEFKFGKFIDCEQKMKDNEENQRQTTNLLQQSRKQKPEGNDKKTGNLQSSESSLASSSVQSVSENSRQDDHDITKQENATNVESRDDPNELYHRGNKSQYTEESDTVKNERKALKEFRSIGNFGDDFEVSSITNLFRGGWHRALHHEHLANVREDKI